MLTSPELIAAAREALGMSQSELAQASKLGLRTIRNIETRQTVGTDVFELCQKALEARGVEFFQTNNRAGFSIPAAWVRPKKRRPANQPGST
ncbi:multiprotein-bridging factor 1 family protein [Devosia ginsengisoli]|uniref:helix-turn-helix domain-containing protein n=1 Tax=Devosia ginsengisoli TaxID=400770 RepID=UPI0034E96B5E